VFFLTKPPLLRWAAATVLVLVALWADLRTDPTVPHPFALSDLAAGDTIELRDVQMRSVPPDLFDPVDLPAVAGRAVGAGEPILASVLDPSSIDVPDGWLAVELGVPGGTGPGSHVVAIIAHPESPAPTSHRGLVVSVDEGDGFGGLLATCAFPPEAASAVAVAAAEGRVSVLTGA
jgi:hypothetical protein